MEKVTIVDYGMGNLDSVARAVSECGGKPVVSGNPKDLKNASHLILPGVGAFPEAMEKLRKKGLDKVLQEQVLDNKIPLLGICLGMQLLATKGFEGKETKGLGLIEGLIEKFKPVNAEKIPHVGWNNVEFAKKSRLFQEIDSGKDFYFVHSYYFNCKNKEDIAATTAYCGNFVSAVEKENIFGTQFHPEKSQKLGLRLLANFLEIK